MTLREYFKTIADAIRAKANSTTSISASNFASTIRGFYNFTDAKSASGGDSMTEHFYNPDEGGYNYVSCSFSVEGIKQSGPGILCLNVDMQINSSISASGTEEFVLAINN